MNDLASFRAALARRILASAGVASALATATACGEVVIESAGGAGGGGATTASGTTTSSSSTTSSTTSSSSTSSTTSSTSSTTTSSTTSASSSSGGQQGVERCFLKWNDGPCPPVDGAEAVFGPCTQEYEYVTTWISGPAEKGGACCYFVDVTAPNAPNCVPIPGRPFVVEGRARVAPIGRGVAGWNARAADRAPRSAGQAWSPDVTGLDADTRASLGRAWAMDAAFEHASVASFGKLALELLAFGAPADLVRAAHEAALDEVGHAEMGFALASAYLGSAVGPGALPEARAVPFAATLAELAAAAVREGCFGETLAAVIAAAQREAAADEVVREALARVTEEESRHAELAFRVVAWAVARGGDDVRHAVRGALEASLASERATFAEARDDAHEPVTMGMRAHGRLPMSEVLAERRRAAEEIIVPAMGQLLGAVTH